MEWYWWVLIALGVALVAWLKITVLGKWMAASKAKKASHEAEEE